jgi:flagellar protein FlaG
MEVGKVESLIGMAPNFSNHAPSPEQRKEQDELIRAVQAVGEAKLFGESTELTFSLDRRANKIILKLVDRETQEVIRQLPPEFLLRLAEDLRKP